MRLVTISVLMMAVACGGRSDPQAPGAGDTGTDVPQGETGTTPPTPTDTGTTTTTTTPTTTPVVPDDAQVVDCARTVPSEADRICAVTEHGGDGLLLRGDVLGSDSVYVGGEVLIDADGWIACVGCDCSTEPAYTGATEVNCAEAVVSPGLINPHDHLTYTEGWPIDLGSTRYDHRHGWRGSLSTPQNPHGGGSSTGAGNRWGEVRMLMSGVTSMVGSGRAVGMVRNLEYSDAQEGLGLPYVENQTFPLGDADEDFEDDCDWYYAFDEWEVQGLPAYVPHVAEGIDDYAAEEFFCLSRSEGHAENHTQANAAHVHAIGLTAVDYHRMAYEGTRLVWSPRSNISLYGFTADVATFRRLGGEIALGTDWTYSGSMNMLRELACADAWNRDQLDGWFTDYELWRMATAHGARALGAGDVLGVLDAGTVADVAVFARRSREAHRAVLEAGAGDVALVLRGGQPLFGESETLSDLAVACEAVEVCGEARALCAADEFGVDFASLQAEVDDAYPAFFCDTPDLEPTCVPSRPGEFDGIGVAGDEDGDGIASDTDNCPTFFNPIRPIDGGAQPDADGDGLGDPCDELPLGTDYDGDGTPNAADNCPLDANGDQGDADGDGRGDACDDCPDLVNFGAICPPGDFEAATIVEIQTEAVALGTLVSLNGVVVTGVSSSGYTIQDPSAGGPQHSGLYVFSGSAPLVARGTTLDLIGEVDDYFGETQLSDPVILVDHGGTTTLAPAEVTVAEAATEAYEGVLVRLTDGVVTNEDYDCAVDGSCYDEGLWEIDGADGVVVFDRLYQGVDWASHVGELPVTGVMGYRWDRRRLMPRIADDFGN